MTKENKEQAAAKGTAAAPANPRRSGCMRFSVLDLRVWMAVMLGGFGFMLTVYGLFFVTAEDLAKAAGLNLNLWTGIAMIAGGVLCAWRVATHPESDAGEENLAETNPEVL